MRARGIVHRVFVSGSLGTQGGGMSTARLKSGAIQSESYSDQGRAEIFAPPVLRPTRFRPTGFAYGTSFGNSFLHCAEINGYSHFLPWNALMTPRSHRMNPPNNKTR